MNSPREKAPYFFWCLNREFDDAWWEGPAFPSYDLDDDLSMFCAWDGLT